MIENKKDGEKALTTISAEKGCGSKDAQIEQTRSFLCGYQFSLDMLNLRKRERKRARVFDDPCDCEDLLAGNEAYWHARMYEVNTLIGNMKNGREKLILYYHYIRGESIEHAAKILGVSRRTGYRLHQKGLRIASVLFNKNKKIDKENRIAE